MRRRFVIANQLVTPKGSFLEQKNLALTLPPIDSYGMGWLCPGESLPIRNCPKCAFAIYHSALFNLPWIKECPVHNLALMDKCPTCERDWPSLKTLKENNNHCPMCGTHVSIESIANRLDHQPLQPYHQIRRLLEILFPTCFKTYHYVSYPPTKSQYEYVKRNSIGFDSPDYPSIIGQLYPSKVQELRCAGILVRSVLQFSARRKEASLELQNLSSQTWKSRSPLIHWERRWRRKAVQFITRSGMQSGHTVVPKTLDHLHEPFDPIFPEIMPCALCSAFTLWFYFAYRYRVNEVYVRYQRGSWYYKNPLGFDYCQPLVPQPLQLSHHLFATNLGESPIAYEYPQRLQKLFYYLDLVTCFKAIYSNIAIQHFFSDAGYHPNRFVTDRIEQFLNPTAHMFSDFYCTFEGADTLKVLIPKRVFRPELPDIHPYVEDIIISKGIEGNIPELLFGQCRQDCRS